jgi:hypothetical protein
MGPDPYEQLLALGISALELAREGRLAELHTCQRASERLMAALPLVAPEPARSALERCLVVQRHLEAELRRARGAALAALAEVQRGQRAVSGYAPAAGRRPMVRADA